MAYKFIRCTNPDHRKLKMAYGKLLENWKDLFCECGFKFEEFISDTFLVPEEDNFTNVQADDETKELPVQK